MRDEWFCQLKSKATGSRGIGGLFRFIFSSDGRAEQCSWTEEYESVMHGHVLLTKPRNGILIS